MPLSRLTPRRGNNTLARQKSARLRKADSQRHLHLWTAIRTTQEELDQWQRQIDQVDALFARHIVPREHKLTQAVSDVTEKLIGHFADTRLDVPDKSLLGLWVTDNLNALHDHPFVEASRVGQLSQKWRALVNTDGPVENQLAKLARRHSIDANHTFSETPEEAAQSNKTTSASSTGTREADGEPDGVKTRPETEQVVGAQAQGASQHNESSDTSTTTDTINSLEQKLSVERLFRQLAKVLHPDREQDEAAKAAKHVLMSECLKARQEKNINALLTLYCEHVGELPDDLNNNSHNELIEALEKQLKELQRELRRRRFSDPLHTQIVERYCATTTADCELRINNHAQSLDAEIVSAEKLTRQLDEHDGLVDALDERRSVEQDRMSINEMTGY